MSESLDAAVIIDQLKEKANSILAASLGTSKLEPFNIGSTGNFPYNYQDTANVTLFNKPTYGWISSNLAAGADPIKLSSQFADLYIDALSKVTYKLSTKDQAALNSEQSNVQEQGAALQNAWIAAFGSLPKGDAPITDINSQIMTWTADSGTTLDDVQTSVNPDSLFTKVPGQGQSVMPVFFSYIQAITSNFALFNQTTMNTAYLKRALKNVQFPSAAGGGITLSDKSVVPGYTISPAMSAIQNSMKSGKPEVSLHMSVTRATEKEFSVDVEAKEGVTIPIFDLVTIGITASQDYFSSNIATTDNVTTVDMTYPGANIVNFGPGNFELSGTSTGWFWMKPILDAIKNESQDVSGYQFAVKPQIDFSENGPFCYLEGVAISSYPTMKITVKSSNYKRIEQDFTQSSSLTVSVFGIQVFSGKETTKSVNIQTDSDTQTTTIIISPPPELVASTANSAVGWVLGALPVYPAVT